MIAVPHAEALGVDGLHQAASVGLGFDLGHLQALDGGGGLNGNQPVGVFEQKRIEVLRVLAVLDPIPLGLFLCELLLAGRLGGEALALFFLLGLRARQGQILEALCLFGLRARKRLLGGLSLLALRFGG